MADLPDPGTPPPEGNAPAAPVRRWRPLPRRSKILLFAIVSAAVIVAAAWVATISAPNTATPTVGIATVFNVEVDPGAANALLFPFQLAPDSQSDEDGALAVASASVTVSVSVPACGQSTPSACPGVILEVLTTAQVSQFPTTTNITPAWCTNNSAGTCTATTGGTYSFDMTVFAGQPMDLVVWSPTATQWADLNAQGSWVP
jgi:hypothetical protein